MLDFVWMTPMYSAVPENELWLHWETLTVHYPHGTYLLGWFSPIVAICLHCVTNKRVWKHRKSVPPPWSWSSSHETFSKSVTGFPAVFPNRWSYGGWQTQANTALQIQQECEEADVPLLVLMSVHKVWEMILTSALFWLRRACLLFVCYVLLL